MSKEQINEAIELLENKLAYNGFTYAGQFSYEEHKHLFALLESAKAEPESGKFVLAIPKNRQEGEEMTARAFLKQYQQEIDRLTAELKAQAERIEKLKQELLKRGRHTKACSERTEENMREETESGCTCGGKAEPQAKVLFINTDSMRRAAKSVKDGQGTQVGSLALMLIDCCDYIVRLTAEKKRLLTPTDCETESGGILCIEQEGKILALTAEKQAQAERIEKLKQELLKRGGHTTACTDRTEKNMREEKESGCVCGWDARKSKLQQTLEGEVKP